MKVWQLAVVVIAVFAGVVYGTIESWNFTFGTIVPWLEMPHEWQKLGGVLIWFFGVWELGITLFGALFAIAAVVVVFIPGGLFSLLGKSKSNNRRIRS